ncbi:MAG TPA: AbrB family transcriptional regulator [Capillimicrobium sp.]|nr:AbrB family transcriptional regulator [Capillimicrobium sp.]
MRHDHRLRRARPTSARRWSVVAAACFAGAVVADRIGVPSPLLLVGLVVGVLVAVGTRWELRLPSRCTHLCHGVVGVSFGLLMQGSALHEVALHAVPIAGVLLATLAVSVAAGVLLARITGLDRATASFGMVAGGASGVVALSDGLGADQRLVAVLQYLRVVIIVAFVPIAAASLAAGHAPGGGVAGGPGVGAVAGVATLVVCMAGGALIARVARLPAGSLLGPAIAAATLALVDRDLVTAVPPAILAAAYTGVGLSVGLQFTPESLRAAARLLPPAVGCLVMLLAVTTGLGMLLVPLAGVRMVDAYLATTPGGLYAVLAAAASHGVDATFVFAVQALRLFAMLLAAPLLGRWAARSGAGARRPRRRLTRRAAR